MNRIDDLSNVISKDIYINNILHYAQLLLKEGFSLNQIVEVSFLNYEHLDDLSLHQLCHIKRELTSAYAFLTHRKRLEEEKQGRKCK